MRGQWFWHAAERQQAADFSGEQVWQARLRQEQIAASSNGALARTSTLGLHIVASKSAHWVQFDEPELLVETIREVVEASRRRHVSAMKSG